MYNLHEDDKKQQQSKWSSEGSDTSNSETVYPGVDSVVIEHVLDGGVTDGVGARLHKGEDRDEISTAVKEIVIEARLTQNGRVGVSPMTDQQPHHNYGGAIHADDHHNAFAANVDAIPGAVDAAAVDAGTLLNERRGISTVVKANGWRTRAIAAMELSVLARALIAIKW